MSMRAEWGKVPSTAFATVTATQAQARSCSPSLNAHQSRSHWNLQVALKASKAPPPKFAQSARYSRATHSSGSALQPIHMSGPDRTPSPAVPETNPCSHVLDESNRPILHVGCLGRAGEREEWVWQTSLQHRFLIHLHLRSLLHISITKHPQISITHIVRFP